MINRSVKVRLLDGAQWIARFPGPRQILRAISKDRVPIFVIHRKSWPEYGIHGIDPQQVSRLLDELRRLECNFLSVRELILLAQEGKHPPERTVAFTADDGYADQAELIVEIFADRGVPLTMFLITGFVDGTLWPWDAKIAYVFQTARCSSLSVALDRINLEFPLGDDLQRRVSRRECQAIAKTLVPDRLDSFIQALYDAAGILLPKAPPEYFRPMTWDQARILEQRGIDFAPHTVSHHIVIRQTESAVRDELANSWSRLSQELQNPLKVIAWPVGRRSDFGDSEARIALDLGFIASMSAVDRYSRIRPSPDLLSLDRFGLPDNGDVRATLQFISGLRSVGEFRRVEGTRAVPAEYRPQILGGAPRQGLRVSLYAAMYRMANVLALYRRPDASVLSDVRRLIFVCRGNICRSPYAESVAKSYGIKAISVGLEATGIASANPTATRAAFARGRDLSSHRSSRADNLEIHSSDLLLAMEPAQIAPLVQVAEANGAIVSLLGLWANSKAPYIPDPYGCNADVFDSVFMTIDEAMRRLSNELSVAKTMHLKCSAESRR